MFLAEKQNKKNRDKEKSQMATQHRQQNVNDKRSR
jgi:hypothetical protein